MASGWTAIKGVGELFRQFMKFMCPLNFKRQYRIGRTIAIFFDENSLQLAAASCFGGRPRLLNIAKIYIPETCQSEGERYGFLVQEIGKYVREFGRPLTRYVLGIGGQETTFRIISLPPMSKRELAKAIFWEGDKRIPFGLEKSYFGFRLNEKAKTAKNKAISVSLIAALKDEIDKRLESLEPLNIKIDAIIHESEAIGYLLPFIDDFDRDRTYAMINIKKSNSEISFYRGMQLEFMHISSVGLETLFGDLSDTSDYEHSTEILINEIQNSLDYYIGQFSNTATDVVFVYGDLSYSDDLIGVLSERSGTEFKRFPLSRWIKLQPQMKQWADHITVSLGAAAMAMADHRMVNFLPPAVKEERAIAYFAKRLIPAFSIFLIVLLGLWGTLKFETNIISTRLAAVYEQRTMLMNSPTYLTYNRIRQNLAADSAVVDKLDLKPTHLNLNLKELSRLTPDNIKLNLYELQSVSSGNNLLISGRAISSDPPPELILAEFVVRLENSPFFRNVILNRHAKRMYNGNFAIDFQLKMDAAI